MGLKGTKILLVEDELLIRELFQFTLEMHHAEVRTASNVGEAMRVLTTWNPDVVVTDIGLPEMDGYDLIRALRTAEETKSIPIIALSGYVSSSQDVDSNDPYLIKISKPVDPDYLISVILQKTHRKD